MRVFDYKIISIDVKHPAKPGKVEKDTDKFVLRTVCQCVKFRQQKVVRIYQHDGRGSDEYLREKVIEAMGGLTEAQQKIADSTGNTYKLSSEELAKLKDVDGENLLEMPSCQLVSFKLEHPVCMTYNTDLSTHKKGDLVLRANSKYVRIWDSVTVLCQTFGEPVEDVYYGDGFLSGQRPCEVAESWLRNTTPLSDIVATYGTDVVDPMDLTKYMIDNTIHGTTVPTNNGDADDDLDAVM